MTVRGARARGLGGALMLTAASIVVPGLAHLRARRWVAGTFLVLAYLAAIGAGVWLVRYRRVELLRLALQPRWLTGLGYVAVGLAVIWMLIVWRSYRVLRPRGMGRLRRVFAGCVVLVLCLVACVPFAAVSRYAYVQQDLLASLFAPDSGDSSGHGNPWAGRRRINILLLGGDAGRDRTGVRTDSMTLASIDVHTGRTVLISLPRNMEHVRFPPGRARDRFPRGFPLSPAPGYEGLLNEIYQYGQEHPSLEPGSRHPGGDLLKSVYGYTLGVHVDYFALVNLNGFSKLVDAMGGVWLRVDRPIPYGLRGQVLRPGYRKLNGQQALWYGRSRTDSSDYVRMGRQKCVMAAMVRQANAMMVLRRFESLARATKSTVSTDIPQHLLSPLVQLVETKGKKSVSHLRTLLFVPPRIQPSRPDWKLIREQTHTAIAESTGAASPRPTPSPASSAGHHHRHGSVSNSLSATCPKPGAHG